MVEVVDSCVLFFTGSDKVFSLRGLQKEAESHSPHYLLKFVLGTAMLCSLEVIRMELSGAVCNPAVEVVENWALPLCTASKKAISSLQHGVNKG